jgi:6-phosphogluconate dehydrogenase
MGNATNASKKCGLGMVGLGVMGRNLLLNMAEKGFEVAGFDTDTTKVEALNKEANPRAHGVQTITDFIDLLAVPRVVMMLVPAGKPVDNVIHDLLPHLQKGDTIIDAGNSFFKDTESRIALLAKDGIHFVGVGISGGEKGARLGPSIMPGGAKEAYTNFQPLFEACAAKVNNEPCVAYLGTGAAGHYVKMVHNGIEYAIMELISETYDLLKRGLGVGNSELQQIYTDWNNHILNSYLVEITSHIFGKIDEKTGEPLIDKIQAIAKQLGTGMWTSQSAMELQVPTPTIDMAVAMRDLSMLDQQRVQASTILTRPVKTYNGDKKAFIEQLRKALYAGMVIAYAQGMALLSKASISLNYQLNLKTIASIWRGGCIIRATFLEDMRKAFEKEPTLQNILLDKNIAALLMENEEALREVVKTGADLGIPLPCLMTSLSYLDGYRSAWLPANLIQAQRDYFGSHTYERTDEKGTFHTEWENPTC